MYRLFLLLISLACVACASPKPTTQKTPSRSTTLPARNNLVSITAVGAPPTHEKEMPQGGTKIEFEGSHNIFEVIDQNPAYFDQAHHVIIVKGDHNLIRLYPQEMVKVSTLSADTLVLVGHKKKYVVDFGQGLPLKSNSLSADTVYLRTVPFNFNALAETVNTEEPCWETIKALQEEIKAGNQSAYYRLAEMFNFGLEGAPISSQKAIAFYEYGASQKDIMAIRRLGDLWFNGNFDHQPNKPKGIFYYSMGAALGDSYCQMALSGL